ncbi:HesB-like protein [Clostridium sp.]|jgi:HesB-like selenoprotein|uniref:HesB-like protein n=1 Tax=Clostridium sp. TaxID=1506 RepID=UPI003A5BF52A
MKFMKVSDGAYDELKSLLDSNNVESYNLRIKYLGSSCSGPVFNIYLGKESEYDIVDTVKEINFIVDRDIVNTYGGFTILSSKESQNNQMELKPFISQSSGCNGCSGCGA